MRRLPSLVHSAVLLAALTQPAAAVSLGFDGLQAGMSREAVSQLLAERGIPLTHRPDGLAESRVTEARSNVQVTILVTFASQASLSGVEFQVSDADATPKFLLWLSEQVKKWGSGQSRTADPSRLREDFCASQNVNVVVTLQRGLATLGFNHNPGGFALCRTAALVPPEPPVLYPLPRVALAAPTGNDATRPTAPSPPPDRGSGQLATSPPPAVSQGAGPAQESGRSNAGTPSEFYRALQTCAATAAAFAAAYQTGWLGKDYDKAERARSVDLFDRIHRTQLELAIAVGESEGISKAQLRADYLSESRRAESAMKNYTLRYARCQALGLWKAELK